MKAPKQQRLWGITYCNSPEVMPHTIRRTRRDAIKELLDNDRSSWTYARWKQYGCRAVRVTVQAEPTP